MEPGPVAAAAAAVDDNAGGGGGSGGGSDGAGAAIEVDEAEGVRKRARGHQHPQSRVERVRLIGQAREVQGLQKVHGPHQSKHRLHSHTNILRKKYKIQKNTKYTCDTGQTRNKLLAQWVHLTNHAAGDVQYSLSYMHARMKKWLISKRT